MALEHEALTGAIIGAAIEVHRTLGPGFIESIYKNALRLELGRRMIDFQSEVGIPIHYLNADVGLHRLDLFVERRIVVELKAVQSLELIHFAIARSYLRAVGVDHGLLLNFAKATLEIRRITTKPVIR